MKSLTTFATLLLLTLVSGADETPAAVSFVNYSDDPVSLYFYDEQGDEYHEMSLLEPYAVFPLQSYLGHRFAYDLLNQKRVTYDVTKEKDVHIIGLKTNAKQVLCSTTQGDLHITVQPRWSPLGAARFLELVTLKYFDGCALNRVVKGFLTQFGIGADYDQRTKYRERQIPDDVQQPIDFKPGYMAYAGSGPNSRTTEMFIVMPGTPEHQLEAFGMNPWETPFAHVGADDVQNVVAKWYAYGDMPPWGQGPDPQKIYKKDGYDYLKDKFPKMDYIQTCRIVGDVDEEGDVVEEVEEEEL